MSNAVIKQQHKKIHLNLTSNTSLLLLGGAIKTKEHGDCFVMYGNIYSTADVL